MAITKLKRIVIKEELVAITNDFINAAILNQFLYWTDRVNDFDLLLGEEMTIASKDGIEFNVPLKHGWIYKKAEQLNDEMMLGMSISGLRNRIKKLVTDGYLLERNNPNYKWDHTKQYRVNFTKLHADLAEKGYTLQGYRITEKTATNGDNIEFQKMKYDKKQNDLGDNSSSKCVETENRISKNEIQDSETEIQYQRLYNKNNNSLSISARARKESKPTAHKHGEYGWVRLTDDQHKRLFAEYGNETVARVIQYVDELAQQTENKNGWKDWNLVIRRAIRENWGTDKFRRRNNNVVVDGEHKPSYDLDEFERHSIFDSDDWEKIFCGNSKIGSNSP